MAKDKHPNRGREGKSLAGHLLLASKASHSVFHAENFEAGKIQPPGRLGFK